MILEIEPAVLEDSKSFTWLNRLMYLVMDGQHVLRVKDENIENSKWFNGLGHEKESFKEIIQRSWGLSLNNGYYTAIRVSLSSKVQDGSEMSPEAAYHYLCKPLYIFVENGESDGCFLKLIMLKYSKDLKRSLKGGDIVIDGSGGKDEMIKLCMRKISGSRPRIIVLLDSDALYSGQIKDNTRKITEKMKEKNVPCFVTIKRESENYIPIFALEKWAEQKDPTIKRRVDAFRSLSDIQRDYFDMKDGFKNGIPKEQIDIYVDLPDPQNDFATGFGPKVWQAYDVALESISRSNFDSKSSKEFQEIVKGIYSRA